MMLGLYLVALLSVPPAHSLSLPAAPVSRTSYVAPDPVGSYDIEFEMHGERNQALLRVTKQPDGRLEATLEVHGQSIPFDAVSLEGRDLTLTSLHGSGLTLTLTFQTDDQISGSWSMQGNTGGLAGSRRKS